jgi:alpha-1,2-mannosyltransferase
VGSGKAEMIDVSVQPRAMQLARNGWAMVEPLVCGVIPVILTTVVLLAASQHRYIAVDFHEHFWPAAYQVLHGNSPFPAAHAKITLGSFIYPAFAAVLIVPFALFSRTIGDPLFVVILATALFLTLRLLRIRDWRIYGIVLAWAPVFHALHTANFTLLIGLALAALWRFRDRPVAAGAIIGSVIALKVFFWPLVIWIVAAKRYRTAAWSVAFAAVITIASWSAVGFAGLTNYPRMVATFDGISAPATYTLVGAGVKLGLGRTAAEAVAWLVGLAALAFAVELTRRYGLDPRSFAAILLAAILLSPIVWLHYFALLVVPLALFRPRFGPLWLVPILAWPLRVGPAGPSLLSIPLLAGTAILLALAARRQADTRHIANEPIDRLAQTRPAAVVP